MGTEINIGGGFWLVVQVALWVLYYGGVYPELPWWVVWAPTLIVAAGLSVCVSLLLVIIILAVVSSP